MKADAWQRLPLKAMAAMCLRGIPSVASLLLAGFLYCNQPGLWPGPAAVYIVGGLLVIRLVHPVFTWSTLKYAISDDSFTLVRGFIFRTTSITSWRDVSVVDIESPWAFRRFGLGVISLRSGGQNDITITVPGIAQEALDTIVGLARTHGAPSSLSVASDNTDNGVGDLGQGPPVTSRTVLYTARKRDLVTANLIYGHVVALGIGAVVTLVNMADQLAILDGVLNVFNSNPWAGTLIMCVAVLGGGAIISLVKYHGFTVSGDSSGLSIAYGRLSTSHRDVKSSAVGGIAARRNIIEMLLDRVRIAILTTDSDSKMGTNMVLPSLPRRQVKAVLDVYLRELPKPTLLESSGRGSLARSLVILVTAAALSLGSGWVLHYVGGGSPILVILASAITLFVFCMGVRLAKAEFAVTETKVRWVSHSFADHEVVLVATSLHSMSATSARTTRLSLVRVHYLEGRPKTLSSLCVSRAVSKQMERLLTDTSSEISANRLRSTVKPPPPRSQFIHDQR